MATKTNAKKADTKSEAKVRQAKDLSRNMNKIEVKASSDQLYLMQERDMFRNRARLVDLFLRFSCQVRSSRQVRHLGRPSDGS